MSIIASFRRLAAIALGKTASLLIRALRLGGGTNLPGTLARAIAPDLLRHLAGGLPRGVILLSGTNGKTTTTRMIAHILRAEGLRVLHNRAGANLVSGLTATALAHSTMQGRPRADIGLFETDEAALPRAIAETTPRLVIIHNLFRDQLDRYGEVDTVAQAWRVALETLPPSSLVLLNADDPAVAHLGEKLAAQVRYYGLEDARHATGAATHTADSHFCRRCGARYTFLLSFYGHIGHYTCPECGHHRPSPHIQLEHLDLQGTDGSHLTITQRSHSSSENQAEEAAPATDPINLHLPLPGLYNALNALAATAAALALDIPPATICAELAAFRAAFGRIERVEAGTGGAPILIALIKNPVGASETVRMLVESATSNSHPLHTLIAINDRYADGTDVSWLWDADFEPLAPPTAHAVASGTRATDMAVRLKYAGVAPEHITLEPELPRALDTALAALPADHTLFVLPTYTAMLDLRAELARRGWVRPFWEE
jgi:UDP-N-acetylmuramyl tripeptide synthase